MDSMALVQVAGYFVDLICIVKFSLWVMRECACFIIEAKRCHSVLGGNSNEILLIQFG